MNGVRIGDQATNIPGSSPRGRREILLTLDREPEGDPAWLGRLGHLLEPRDMSLRHADPGEPTLRYVERGGLSAAVVLGGTGQDHGLRTLRLIRSVDRVLPCWLITPRATRPTLEAAFALSVVSVLPDPVEVADLVLALVKRLCNPSGESFGESNV